MSEDNEVEHHQGVNALAKQVASILNKQISALNGAGHFRPTTCSTSATA